MQSEALKMVHEGKSLMFTFRYEALEFVDRYKLSYDYIEASLTDEEHIKIKGYNSEIYWIAR